MDLIKKIREAMGQRDNDYLILQNKWHTVEISHIEGRFYTDGEKGWVGHDSVDVAFNCALEELALYEQGRVG